MNRFFAIARRLPALTLLWLILARMAPAAELEAIYPDGEREKFVVSFYEGVDHLNLKALEQMLLQVDSGARIEPEYTRNELRIIVQGQSVTISDEFTVAGGTVLRPEHPLRFVAGEFLVPVETLQEINNVLNLMRIERPGMATPSIETVATPLSAADYGPAATPPETALETPLPGDMQATPPDEGMAALPAIQPLSALSREDSLVPALNRLLGDVALPGVSSVAIVAYAADPLTYGEHATEASAITDRAARVLRETLEATGRFRVQVPEQPWSAQNLDQTIDWVNSQQCDVLIALAVDATTSSREQGVRVMIAHEASDAAARQALGSRRRGLPQKLNYIPYEQKSMQLARLVQEEMGRSPSLAVQEIELAPLFLLRRVAMPSVEISLGSVSSDGERALMAQGRFAGEVARAITTALNRMQQSAQEN